MTGKRVIAFFVSFLLIITIPTVALAEIASTGTSQATITFTPNTDPTDPVDPEDPSQPLDPEDPDNPTDPGTGEPGPLSLDYVSSIHFGEYKQLTQPYYEAKSIKPFIQVSDKRGTGAGWKVIAQASPFTNEEGIETLPGATITLRNGEAVAVNPTNSPQPAQEVKLVSGGEAVTVVTAEPHTGMGTWVTRWFPSNYKTDDRPKTNDNVTLEIPDGYESAGKHSATITWTLMDAPN